MDTVVVAFISFILMLSIGFELAHHHLKETTPEAFQPILTSLYSELTLLGFIGLLMFTIFKLEILEELSKHLFGEGEEIKELGEQVHMVLFGVMALFLAQAVALAKFGEFIQRKWHVWECTPLVSKADEEERYKSLKAAAKLAKNPATFWTFALKNRMSARGVPYRVVSGNDGRRAGPRSIDSCCIRPHGYDSSRRTASRIATSTSLVI